MEKLTNIKLIGVDMDGTLLDDQKRMDERTQEIVEKLRARNIHFTFISGRNMHIMQDFVQALDLDIPYITNNGANMFQKTNCIYECSIYPFDLFLCLNVLQAHNIPFIAYSSSAVYPMGNHPGLDKFLNRLRGKSEIMEDVDIHMISKHAIFKIVVINDDEQEMNQVMKEINDNSKEAHCVRSEGNIYTITHLSATKGNTLKKLMEQLSIQPEEVLVFGDNYNDQSMFEVAKYSVSMANSSEEIKAKTTFVTDSNNEHGVTRFIEQYIL